MVTTKKIAFQTRGNCDIIDITQQVAKEIGESHVREGAVTLFAIGSTGGISTIENEGGLLQDFKDVWERIAPRSMSYLHDQAWADGNGHSHVRASIVGPSLTIPFVNGSMLLGTWQQIIFIDFDNRSRRREVVVQIIGE